MARIDIDVSNVADPFAVAPHGTYELRVKETELTTAQSSGAPMVKAQYEIQGDPEHAGKVVFDNLVLNNKFGQFRLAALCKAGGLSTSNIDTDDLVGIVFQAEVDVQSDQQYGDRNVIRKILQ